MWRPSRSTPSLSWLSQILCSAIARTTQRARPCQIPLRGATGLYVYPEQSREPDPERHRLALSIFQPSSLHTVAQAVAAAAEDQKRVYVERVGDAWRWSLTDSGGPGPLLRTTARFLRTDYRYLSLGCRAVADNIYVLCEDALGDADPDAWAILEFDNPAQTAEIKERIWRAFGPENDVT
jgi:hypothetical protein